MGECDIEPSKPFSVKSIATTLGLHTGHWG